jgi:tetratricopeptide (TPR) repeat protein
MKWLAELRPLFVIYGIAAVVGWWETVAVQRSAEPTKSPAIEYPDVTVGYAVVSQELYPERMSSEFWRGYAAFQQGQFDEASRHFKAARNRASKNRQLLYSYAVTQAILDANSTATEAAIKEWEWNYPNSKLVPPLAQARSTLIDPLLARGQIALAANDFATARNFFEEALKIAIAADNVPEPLVHHYAVCLILSGAPPQHIEVTIAQWRQYFPQSTLQDPHEVARNWNRR